jgi:hypothetical protein
MKNPFKGLGGKIKAGLDRFKMSEEKSAEFRKNTIDSFGDGCFVGGLTLVGAAIFAPVATGPTLAAAALFLAAGSAAKYTAGKMDPSGPTLEKALPPEKSNDNASSVNTVKPLGPQFKKALDGKAKQAEPKIWSRFIPGHPQN